MSYCRCVLCPRSRRTRSRPRSLLRPSSRLSWSRIVRRAWLFRYILFRQWSLSRRLVLNPPSRCLAPLRRYMVRQICRRRPRVQ